MRKLPESDTSMTHPDTPELKEGDIVVQNKMHDVQIEGIFDNAHWLMASPKGYLEAISFDGQIHCSVGILQEIPHTVVGNIQPLLTRLLAKRELEGRIAEVDSALAELEESETGAYPVFWNASDYVPKHIRLAELREELATYE